MNNQIKLEKAKEFIHSADLNFVIDRLVNIEKWEKSEAEQAVQQYRNYLFLLKKYSNDKLPPSKDIDEVWHAHILHTKEYREFCVKVFDDRENKFLDHFPQLDRGNADAKGNYENLFEKTQLLYFQEFGDYIYQIRGISFAKKIMEKIGVFLFRDEKLSASL